MSKKLHKNAYKAFVIKMQTPLSGGNEILLYDNSGKITDMFPIPNKKWHKKVFKGKLRIYCWVFINEDGILGLPEDGSANVSQEEYERVDFKHSVDAKTIFNF